MYKTIKDPLLFKSIKEFLTVYAPVVRRKSKNTVKSYKDVLNLYFDFLLDAKQLPMCDVCTADFNRANILAFISWLQEERGNAASSINQRLAQIRTFCNYIMKNDLLTFNELNQINEISRITDTRKNPFIFLSLDDVKLVLQQPDLSKKTGIRDKFYISLLYDSGCRDQELLDLKLKDFDVRNPNTAELHIIGKGNKYRVTPISSEVVKLFVEYRNAYHLTENKDPESYIFYTKKRDAISQMSDDNVQRFLRKYENQIRTLRPDFPHLHAHLFRRSRAMHLYMAGVPLPLIAEWLGHSNLETVQVYARATVEMKRKAVAKLSTNNCSVHNGDVAFKYADDKDALQRLCGLR